MHLERRNNHGTGQSLRLFIRKRVPLGRRHRLDLVDRKAPAQEHPEGDVGRSRLDEPLGVLRVVERIAVPLRRRIGAFGPQSAASPRRRVELCTDEGSESTLGRRALRGHKIQIGGQIAPYVRIRALQIGIPNRRDAQPRRLLVVLRHGPTLSCKPLKSRLKLRRELPLSFAILQWPLRQGVRRGRAHAVAHDGLHELGHPACEGLVGDEFVGKEAASHDGIDVFAHV